MFTLAAFMLCFSSAQADAEPAKITLQPGMWRGWLESPGGELPFEIEFERVLRESSPTDVPDDLPTALRSHVINGTERIAPSSSTWVKDPSGNWWLEIRFDHYDSKLRATPSGQGTKLSGNWIKRRGPDKFTNMPFRAEYVPDQAAMKTGERRFRARPAPPGATSPQLAEQYRVDFESSNDPAIGRFSTLPHGVVHGTFLTTTGDYRYLAGTLDAMGLRLSCFDGAHAFLFSASMDGDGRLSGKFYSRESWQENWTAVQDSEIKMPDAWQEVGLLPAAERADWRKFELTQLDGQSIRLGHPSLHGKARLLVLFGSWCPNCYDEHAFLKELHSKYAEQGLVIQSLAFELGGERKRDLQQLQRYRDALELPWPVLLVTSTIDKQEAAEAFPILSKLKSYPTTLFVDAAGNIQAVHSGFSGPATGEEHQRLRRHFDERVRALLQAAEQK